MTEEKTESAPAEKKRGALRRFLPLGVIVVALIVFFALDLQRFFTLDALKQYQGDLKEFANAHPFLAPLAMVAVYAALVAISFPGASFLTIFAGFMFGTLVGGLAVVVGATLGATAIFLIARTALGETLRKKAGPWMSKFQKGFEENEFSYLLILRLVPAFPFWLVNIAPALFGARLRTYIVTTFIGIIPGTFVYASVGAGAGAVLDAGDDLKLSGLLLKPEILTPIIGLIVLALIPIAIKKFRKKPVPGLETPEAS